MTKETAMKILKKLHSKSLFAERTALETLIPELTESEGEKIRKALVDALNKNLGNGIEKYGTTLNAALTWLEKQGSQQPTIIWHSVSEEPEEMKELFCEWESDDATWHDVAFYDEESKTFRHAKMPINVTKWVYVDELLEKQGEQKPAVVDFNAKDWYVSKVDGKIHDMTYNPADKVEPKFKVGDVLCDKSCTTLDKNSQPNIEILDIRNGMYIYNNCSFPISQQDEYELVAKFDKYEGLTDFERALADICIGWIGEELGWKQYIKDNADVLLKIAIKKFNSIQDAPFEQKSAAWSEEDEKIRNALIKGVECCKASGWTNFGNNVDIDVVLAWLEKQGEQKPIDYNEELKKCRENPLYFFDKYVKLEEQKSADKVEPKFKVGDFIVNDYCVGRVVEITNDAYLLDTGQGIPFSCEHNVHLWTINDAKDGDVLVENKGDIILMFRRIGNTEWNDVIDYHCYYDCYRKDFIVQKDCQHWGDTNNNQLKPATKEQSDLLFAKMKEAGYAFDFEKKELKKIEDEIEIPFGAKDSELQEETYYIPKGFHTEIDDDKVVIKKGKKSAAWSEEDEKMLMGTIDSLEVLQEISSPKMPIVDKEINWLKSLKDRIIV